MRNFIPFRAFRLLSSSSTGVHSTWQSILTDVECVWSPRSTRDHDNAINFGSYPAKFLRQLFNECFPAAGHSGRPRQSSKHKEQHHTVCSPRSSFVFPRQFSLPHERPSSCFAASIFSSPSTLLAVQSVAALTIDERSRTPRHPPGPDKEVEVRHFKLKKQQEQEQEQDGSAEGSQEDGEVGRMKLSGDVFCLKPRLDIIHRVVRWQLAKRRQGTHSTKSIAEVSGTGKKPWAQKGSGRARHGNLRAPQFRGGGISHGPKPRSHAFKLQKKVRRLGLKMSLSARLAEGKLLIYKNLVPESQKTKEMAMLLQQEFPDAKRILLVDGDEKVNENLSRATSNLYRTNILPWKGLNVYSIVQHDTVVMASSAVRAIEERLHTPIKR
eukprot:TRINITY_DN320_c2_g1_i3.p1 TRINITY_DN320_c2_g1~~TRINITY_DN320_c2_g1_i3.p1  ORF type:complete len:382 (+),score=70.22 TRINITY_DN320_c2_g1_i3:46-1191(+)